MIVELVLSGYGVGLVSGFIAWMIAKGVNEK